MLKSYFYATLFLSIGFATACNRNAEKKTDTTIVATTPPPAHIDTTSAAATPPPSSEVAQIAANANASEDAATSEVKESARTNATAATASKKLPSPRPTERAVNAKNVKLNSENAKATVNPNAKPVSTTPKSFASIKFDKTIYDFGFVEIGKKITHEFSFTNVGNAPLIITDASSTCGCTVPDAPKEPIPPGGTATMKVVFDTAGKVGVQNKQVTVTTNGSPSTVVVAMKGVVTTPDEPKKGADEEKPMSDKKENENK